MRQTTLERLLAGTAYRRRGVDGDPAARIKGDARMATVPASAVAATVRPPERAVDATTEALDASLRADRGRQRALDRIWPPLNAAALVRRLLTNRNVLRTTAAGLLDAGERALLARPAARRVTDEPWTLDDLALLDEAESLLVGPPPAYGHVVVDEAQDLSAMGFRALARRSPAPLHDRARRPGAGHCPPGRSPPGTR